ncbi:hypothetical protein WA026_003470 [Henosepilachna vigintioctopunctata]|uniref:C2H2-type domain-containing protein n=1 Tax=Henosepilachna vigintioctopunctata TaxID=420089 RepID=A0AAW1TIF3_9CUCU
MKRKGHLAVFENILEESTSKNQQHDDDSNDLIEEEETERVKVSTKLINLKREPRLMLCKYKRCSECFTDYYQFNKHLTQHIKKQEDNTECQFGDCDFRPINTLHALQHISLHGYNEKLRNLGEIVARRNSLPDCFMEYAYNYPTNIETYACEWEDCGMIMETYCDFLFHIKMHVNGNPRKAESIKCGWQGCSKTVPMLYQLTKHIPVHTKEKYIACPTCGNSFSSQIRYSDHRSKQLPIEKQNYKCSQCSKHFATENLLRDHVRAHINQYKCSLCDMTCPKPSNLAIHMRYRHLNERPFKCNLCDHASITKQNLEMHLITHCAEKLLACDECDFKCRSMVGLDKHIQREHGQNYGQKFECHICQNQYNRGGVLTKHLIKAHGVQWPSGHSRFRYKEDPDGICRLQTIRYETVDVIKEILKSKNEPPTPSHKKFKCFLSEKQSANGQTSFEAKIEEVTLGTTVNSKEEKPKKIIPTSNNVLLTISDLDDLGNVVTEVTESHKVICKEEFDYVDEKFLELN